MTETTAEDAAMDLARACGDEVTVRKMIQEDINVNQKTKWGSSLIEHACLAGYPEYIVKILLDAGATDEPPGYYKCFEVPKIRTLLSLESKSRSWHVDQTITSINRN